MRPARCLFVMSVIAVLTAAAPVVRASAYVPQDEPYVVTVPAVADCDVKGGIGTATTSYCTQPSMNVGYASGSVPLLPYARRALLRFHVGGLLPPSALLLDATLSLTLNGTKPSAAAIADVHEPGAAWTTSATWRTSDGTTPWPAEGGAPSPAVVASASAGPYAGRVSWTGPGLASLVDTWRASEPANRGVLVKQHAEGPGESNMSFASSEANDPATRPALTLRYALPPGIPNLHVTAGVRSLTASWSAPFANGSPITSYTVQVNRGATVVAHRTTTERTFTLSGLTDGTAYDVSVAATNAAGTGTGAGARVVVAGAPAAPTGLAVTATSRSLAVSWDAPAPGSAPVRGYVLTVSGGPYSTTVATLNLTASDTSATVATGISPGNTYTVSLTAMNDAGSSPAATVTAYAADVPSLPTFVELKPGNGAVRASWGEADGNGYFVTSYTVRLLDDTGAQVASQVVDAAVWADFGGVADGAAYRVEVSATNRLGTGPARVSAPAVPSADLPRYPTDVSGTADDGTVTITWQPPAGGPAPTGYHVVLRAYYQPDRSVTVDATTTSWTVTGLENGEWYYPEVTPFTDAGEGLGQYGDGLLPGLRPDVPTVTASAGAGTVSASWQRGYSAPVVWYVAELHRADDGSVVTSRTVEIGTQSLDFGGLADGTYYVTVVAWNRTGPSEPGRSDDVTVAP